MIKELHNINIDFDDFKPVDDPYSKEYGYYNGNILIGYINFSIIFDRAELNYIYVDKLYRGKGYGEILLQFFIDNCNNINNITLEVNESNIKAISLYQKFGFKKVSIRKKYYKNQDAILMIREMI